MGGGGGGGNKKKAGITEAGFARKVERVVVDRILCK